MRKQVLLAAAVAAAVAIPVGVAVGDGGGGRSDDLGDSITAASQAFYANEPRVAVPEGAPPGTPTRPPRPLTGRGENMRLVANIPIDFGSDIELHGDYAYVGTYGTCTGNDPAIGTPSPGNCRPGTGGITVIDISNPEQPKVAGLFDCAGGQNDVQLSPDGKWAVMAIEFRNNQCHPGEEGTVVISLADPENPVEVAWLPIRTPSGALIGSHNNTLDWPVLYIDQYVSSYNRIQRFDLSTPSAPRELPAIQYGPPQAGFGTTAPHDLIVDHRADGRDLLYASSGNNTADVIDVTNPEVFEPDDILQRGVDPAITFAHQAESNHDDSLLLVTDEYRGGGESRACGKTTIEDTPRDIPTSPTSNDRSNLGALYFYKLNTDGTVKGDGTAQGMEVAGTYNIPLQDGGLESGNPRGHNLFRAQGCTIHIFWQAPNENRLVASWYGRGVHVADFSDPSHTKDLGWFIADGASTWSAKPHNGYIFTGDTSRGFDVLQYTGEQGKRWPTTAGPAEVQRAVIQGATPPAAAHESESARNKPTTVFNTNPGPARLATDSATAGFKRDLKAARIGGLTLKRNVALGKASKRAGTAVATVRAKGGTIVSRMRFKVSKGQKTLKMHAQISGLAGTYRYDVRLNGRRLATGRFEAKVGSASTLRLKTGQALVCKILT
jgi:hypothetical protein